MVSSDLEEPSQLHGEGVVPGPCTDLDGDGCGDGSALDLDCDDFKAFLNPGQPERCGNVFDDDRHPATPATCAGGGCGEGCADGMREGFAALARHPAIAACGGGFTVPGVFHVAGNSSPAPGRRGLQRAGPLRRGRARLPPRGRGSGQ